MDTIEIPPGPLVSGEWLQQHLGHPRVRILDTRGKVPAPGQPVESMRAAFDSEHIPGAAFVEWNRDFIDLGDAIPNQLARSQRFAVVATSLGIDAGTTVVAYDDYHSIFASRLWWALRAMGHDRVRVLDGGWKGWRAERRTVATSPTFVDPAPQPFEARARPELRWDLARVRERAAAPDVVLVDARSRERFAGTAGDLVAGHIPGSVNLPYTELVGEDGYLRPPRELRAAFASAGIDVDAPPAQLVTTCGSGISATVPLLALDALGGGSSDGPGQLGAVYDGSWAEWSRSGEPTAGSGKSPR